MSLCIKLKFVLLFLLLLFVESYSDSLHFPDSNGEIVERGQGYIIRLLKTPNTNIKTVEALFLVKGHPGTGYKVITDFDNYPQFMPNIVASTCIERKASDYTYLFTFKVAAWKIRYTIRLRSTKKEESYSLKWNYVKGDIKNTNGLWEISDYGPKQDYFLVRYKVFTDPGLFVPQWVTNILTAKSVPKMIKKIRERVSEIETS